MTRSVDAASPHETALRAAARAVAALGPPVFDLSDDDVAVRDVSAARVRGWFTASEDERVRYRFAQYLTARAALLETITDLEPLALEPDVTIVRESDRLRAFVVAYAAACLLVRAGRFLVDTYGGDRVIRRKLDEANLIDGLARKQFTRLYRSLTNPVNAMRLREARRFADGHRSEIGALRGLDDDFEPALAYIDAAEPFLRVPALAYLRAYWRYRRYALRRRGRSAVQKVMFRLLELGGRAVAEARLPLAPGRITTDVFARLATLLHPGDVIIARHDHAMSNLFLPGFWPHAALYIGPPSTRSELGLALDEARATRWVDPVRVLEAKKDGVRLRPLEETLAADSVTVLRPRLAPTEIAAALTRALGHEGKQYDFEFDFFRADRMVCTEVIYRAYDGIGPIVLDLTTRAGRPTLSAEDLIGYAIADRGFEPVATFGLPFEPAGFFEGAAAREALCRLREEA
ncbi:MAG: hypothetical protein KDA25_02755 [Phycisphaerales bacterium]|nr:hypothetical protein [Phycisphaerales bacterium]